MDLERLYEYYTESRKISTDTRQISPGCIFFALKGDKFNGNEFAKNALESGASYAVIDEDKYKLDERYLLVPDVLTTLQQLARHHRNQLQIPVIALTGSNGKTTSKELLHAVLSKKFKCFGTKGNLNNHIGVPLTVLSIEPSIEVAVVEMGANHLEEIKLLCEIADPTHGFITNIGKAHIGTFGGYHNIIKGKSELYDHLIKRNGQVFINSNSNVLVELSRRFAEPLFYPNEGDYYHLRLVSADPIVVVKTENDETITTNLIGDYNFENIAAALCIGKFFGVEASLANKAIAEYVPGNMRSQVMKKGTNTIILDAYNANPSSMEAAINNLAAMQTPNKVLILGDMFELEEEAAKEHQAIGRIIREKGFKHVYLCGSLFKSALHEIPDAKYFTKKDELIQELKQFPLQHATVLVKASRGIGLETVLDYI